MKIGYFVALAATAVGAGVAGWYASKVYYDKKAQKVVETGRDPIREDPKEETKEPEKVDIPKDRELFPSSFASPEEKMAHFNSIRDIYHQILDKHNYTSPEEIKDPANQAPIEKWMNLTLLQARLGARLMGTIRSILFIMSRTG